MNIKKIIACGIFITLMHAHCWSISDEQRTQFMRAAEKEDLNTLTRLLDAGINVDDTDENGCTALIYAAWAGQTEAVQLLMTRGANINARQGTNNFTPLMLAAACGYRDIVRLLITAQAHLTCTNKNGLTALSLATQHGDADTITELIAAYRHQLRQQYPEHENAFISRVRVDYMDSVIATPPDTTIVRCMQLAQKSCAEKQKLLADFIMPALNCARNKKWHSKEHHKEIVAILRQGLLSDTTVDIVFSSSNKPRLLSSL